MMSRYTPALTIFTVHNDKELLRNANDTFEWGHQSRQSTLPYGLVWEGHDPWEKKNLLELFKGLDVCRLYVHVLLNHKSEFHTMDREYWLTTDETYPQNVSLQSSPPDERERDMTLSNTLVRSNSTMQRRTTTSTTSVYHYLTHIIWLQSDVIGHTQTARAMETRTILRSSSRSNTKYSINRLQKSPYFLTRKRKQTLVRYQDTPQRNFSAFMSTDPYTSNTVAH